MSVFDRLEAYSAKQGYQPNLPTKSQAEILLEKIHNYGYKLWNSDGSPTELYTAITTPGTQLINAIAGSGKTTLLIFKIMYDIATGELLVERSIPGGTTIKVPGKTLVCTFLRSGAQELEKTLTKWQKTFGMPLTSNQIVFDTLDAEFYHLVTEAGCKINIGDPADLDACLRQAIRNCNITRQGSPLTNEDFSNIGGIISYARGRIGEKKYNNPNMLDYSLTPTLLENLIAQYKTLKDIKNIKDFNDIVDLIYEAVYVGKNMNLLDFIANKYDYIYIDEFQDISTMQYLLLKLYARGKLEMQYHEPIEDMLYNGNVTKGKLICVGDPSQTIYSFRGADIDVITKSVLTDFNPVCNTLSTNWRSPSNILNPIVDSIHHNKSSKDQQITAAKPGGVFNAYAFGTIQDMLKQLVKDIDDDMQNDRDVYILVRNSYDGLIPAIYLASSNKYNLGISSDNMMLKSGLGRQLFELSSLFSSRNGKDAVNAIKLLLGYGNAWLAKQIEEAMRSVNASIWDLPEEDLIHSLPGDVSKVLLQVKKLFYQNGVRDRKKELLALRALYFYLYQNVYKGNTMYQISARAYIELYITILDTYDFVNVVEYRNFINEVSDDLSNKLIKAKHNKTKQFPIKIVTVHEVKGKEAQSVYIWNDSKGVFPSSKCNVQNEELLEEERRVHYIACTRATEKEQIYTLINKEGLFLMEMDCEIKKCVNSRTLSK